MDMIKKFKEQRIEPCIASVCENSGYAVPIRYIVRCILLSGSQLKEPTVKVDGEEVKILILCSQDVLKRVQNETVMCVLYRNEEQEPIVIFMGNHYHGNLPCLTTLPVECELDPCNAELSLGCGVYAYAQMLPNGRGLLVLHPQQK